MAVILGLIASVVIGGRIISVIADDDEQKQPLYITKDEGTYSARILKKMDEVLKNQQTILQELKDIKSAVSAIKK